MADAPEPLKRGDVVEVFYRFSCDSGGYFPVSTVSAGTLRPRFGRTDGWIVAQVEADWPPLAPAHNANGREPRVRIRHTHPHWANRNGELLNPERDEDMLLSTPRRDVRRHDPANPHAPVALSLLVVRWGGETTPFNDEQWGSASSSVSDTYISAFVDGALYERLGPDFEVLSAFIAGSADLERLHPSVVLSAMRGVQRRGCYFLWPTTMQDGAADQCGMVAEASYFACVRAMEASGLPTGFPHPSQLYRTLLAKEWQSALCLFPKNRIPPTTTVNRADVVADPLRAARCAVESLAIVRAARYAKAAEPAHMAPPAGGMRRGVAKLGFSWEASHVCFFNGERQLSSALSKLANLSGSEAASLIVQDFVPSDFEARAFVVGGKVENIIYSNFGRTDPDGFPVDFVKLEREEAVHEWMGGDEKAMAHAERRIEKLVAHWLVWLRCRSAAAVPALRVDILVRRAGAGRADISTLELTELGFSMLAWEEGPPKVFGALLDHCLGLEEAAEAPAPAEAAAAAAAGGGAESTHEIAEETSDDDSDAKPMA